MGGDVRCRNGDRVTRCTATASPGASATAAPTPTGSRSPYAFQGSVVALGNGGLDATVVRKDGVVVEVHGGTGRLGAVGPDDRIFVVGAVYQFEPLNSASPYQDNACTATRVIWSPTVGVFPNTDPEQPWLGYSAFDVATAGLLALMLGGAIGARVGFGRGRRAHAPEEDEDDDDEMRMLYRDGRPVEPGTAGVAAHRTVRAD